MKTTLTLDIQYDPKVTDPESLATAMDRLTATALSTPGILDEYGTPDVGEFSVLAVVDPSRLRIDPKLLRRQQDLLARVADCAHRKIAYVPDPEDEDLLEGLLGLAAAVADSTAD
jgi:hypothetical protein